MLKHKILLSLLVALVIAQNEEITGDLGFVPANWTLSETTKEEWLWCEQDADCENTHFCVKIMWRNELANEYTSGTGCAWKSACNGTATWLYYNDTQWI